MLGLDDGFYECEARGWDRRFGMCMGLKYLKIDIMMFFLKAKSIGIYVRKPPPPFFFLFYILSSPPHNHIRVLYFNAALVLIKARIDR